MTGGVWGSRLMAQDLIGTSMSTYKPEREPPDGENEDDGDITPDELDVLAEEAFEGDAFVSFEEHEQRRDD